ncbi:MAG TPA: heme-binding protein [Gemmatimonadales bacterium]|nr:heme-binding protein [Gemmatimonadales bacterium]
MRMQRSLAAAVLAGIAGLTPAAAQVIERPTLTLEGARRVIAAVADEARKRHTTGAIAVVDDGGNVMALERLDRTFAAGARISIGKARTAALFKKPTRVFEEIVTKGRTPMLALDDFTPLMGGVPVEVNGAIVGAVGVSGASSAAEDEELAVLGARALDATPMAGATPGVSVFDKEQVARSFAMGGVLLDGKDGRSYQVHTSKRDSAGKVEVHSEDTDIFYVLSGAATLVTGGTMIGGTPAGPGELRGDSIDGGQVRRIVKGDVVVIPAGTPHWFKEVSGPITYYTVKAR